MQTATPSGRLVTVASRLSLWEAELARARLSADGISACLGNAAMVLWFWHYRDAVGGVTVHVLDSDAERAREIVHPAARPVADGEPPWACPACRQRVEASWEICWNCGTSHDGAQPPARYAWDGVSDLHEGTEGPAESDLIAIAVLATIALLVCTGDLVTATLAWAILAAGVAWYRGITGAVGGGPEPEAERRAEPEPVDDPARESLERRRRMGEAIALRAWQASVLGFFWFPPLLLYSTRLLIRLDPEKTPIGRLGKCRRRAAWAFSLTGILLFGLLLLFFGLLVLYVRSADAFHAVSQAVRTYFDFSGDAPPWP